MIALPETSDSRRETLLQIFYHVAALHEPCRKSKERDAWRAVNYFRWRYPSDGVRLTSIMAGITSRTQWHASIRELKQQGLIRERKSGSTKTGNSFWLTARGLDAGCLLTGIQCVMDCEVELSSLAICEVEHAPEISRHTWAHEQCLVQPGGTIGSLQTLYLPLLMAGLVESNCDAAGRAAYRLADPVSEWLQAKADAHRGAAAPDKPQAKSGVLSLIDRVCSEQDCEPVELLTGDVRHLEAAWFQVYLDEYFTMDGLPGYEDFGAERNIPVVSPEALWANVDRAGDNLKSLAASVPAGELGQIPMSASHAPHINYGQLDNYNYGKAAQRGHTSKEEAKSEAAKS